MTPHQYLEGILKEEKIPEDMHATMKSIRKEVKDFLISHYQEEGKNVNYIYSGSLAKGTAIKSKCDIDIVVIFDNGDFETLEDMFDDVKDTLERKYGMVNIREQNVSIRVDIEGHSVDVVPGRKIVGENGDEDDEYREYDVFLYVNRKRNNRIKTNIKKHIDVIGNFPHKELIKLLKVWRLRKNFKFKSFALELLTIRALEVHKDIRGLDKKFSLIMKFIDENLDTVALVDPANTNNNVMDSVTEEQKNKLKKFARRALKCIENNDWYKIFDYSDGKCIDKNDIKILSSSYTIVHKPWGKDWDL